MQRFRSVTLLPATAAVLFLAGSLRAGDISVTAELTRSRINEGEMAELQVKVTGAQQADLPREIGVDGLQIRLTGQSTQVQMVNFKVSSSVIYSYIVMPLRTGSFTVPSITVTADGKSYRTPQLPFTVESGRVAPQSPSPSALQQTGIPGMMPRRPRTSQQRPEGRLAFGEISCPKKTLYAGEVVPVEIRYYFDGRYPVQVTGRVDFGAGGRFGGGQRWSGPGNGAEAAPLAAGRACGLCRGRGAPGSRLKGSSSRSCPQAILTPSLKGPAAPPRADHL
jgi:hypothetical protein